MVPFVFVLEQNDDGEVRLYWVVDDKPKRSTTLQRLRNLRAHPAVEVVIDAYDEGWASLWWVRMRGEGRVVTSPEERRTALSALAAKYPQYRTAEPSGDVIAIDVDVITSWSGDES